MKKYWILVLIIFMIEGFAFCQNGVELFSDTSTTLNKYYSLIIAQNNYQSKLSDSINFFQKIKNDTYVLNGEDILFINLELSKGLIFLKQSIDFYETGEEFIKTNINLKSDENKLCFLRLLFTHLKIKSFETFILHQEIVGQNLKVIRLINEENILYSREKNLLKKITKKIISERFRKSILKSWKNIINYSGNGRNAEIAMQIVSSKYYQVFLSDKYEIKKSKSHFKYLIKQKRNTKKRIWFHDFERNIIRKSSKIFGNFVGEFALRKGKLYNNEEFINSSLKQLQPLDVIIEKTPFRLTDIFIPGYWGHAAIYLGNETQLKDLGVWDNPFVAVYHDKIKNGCVVVEALRNDVELNTFRHFSNIDDFAQLRLREKITLEKKRKMIIRAFAQIGKKYDFGFDVELNDKIVCSELHYIVFDQILFNTSEIMKRNTITVDQIAERALLDREFLLKNLFLNGIKVKNEKMQELFDLLIGANSRQIKEIKNSLYIKNN